MDNFYLNKYSFCVPQIQEKPNPEVDLIVVIPCFDEPDLLLSLEALKACKTSFHVEVLVVVNHSEKSSDKQKERNHATVFDAEKWFKENSNNWFRGYVIKAFDLPKKHAGVGLARKIGMDEAVARFDGIGKDGIIVMFDADSQCQSNYLQEIGEHFKQHPKTPGCSIHFEHPLRGVNHQQKIYDGITKYELFLRYYLEGLRLAKLPYAFHTVGSSMAVRSSAYQKQGGMNKRKAGEDFYFIQKIIELGSYTDLNTTCVIPSPRISDRVPFGTGKAIGDWVQYGNEEYLTYHPQTFRDLVPFANNVDKFYTSTNWRTYCSAALLAYLSTFEMDVVLEQIRQNSSSVDAFVKRFFRWFNAFKVLKYVHFVRDNQLYQQEPIEEAARNLLQLKLENTKELLLFYRAQNKKARNVSDSGHFNI